MRVALLLILLGMSCCSSSDSEVIVGVSPFRNLSCAFGATTPSVVAERTIKFASRYGFVRRSNEFSTLLTTARLNFVVTYAPNAPVYVTGIARTPPTGAEAALFDQFVSSLPVRCMTPHG